MRNWSYTPYILIGLLALITGILAWKTYHIAQALNNPEIISKHQKFHSKYAKAIVQPVTFYAQESSCSSQMIARKGIIFRKPGARATIMICHGFMCNKTDIRFLRMLFHDYNVMIFDFRAHGESKERQLCTFGHDEMYDIMAAAHFIKEDPELGKMPLIGFGFSMGAVSAIKAQSNAQIQNKTLFDCAVLDCPFDSTDALLDRSIAGLTMSFCGCTVPMPGRGLLKKYAYNTYVQTLLKFLLKTVANMDASPINTQMMPIDTVHEIGKVTIPTFFIVCRNDEKAPPHAVKKVYDNAQGYKRFWVTNGRHHFDSFFYDPEKYAHKVRRFVEKFLDNNFEGKVKEKMYQDAPEI